MILILLICTSLLQLNNTALAKIQSSSIIFPHYYQLPIPILDTKSFKLAYTQELALTNRERFINVVNGASCAVVGSSSNLLGSGYGEFIDNHEVVLRMNDSPVNDNFSKDVGARTTVRLINDSRISAKDSVAHIDLDNTNHFLLIRRNLPHQLKKLHGYEKNIVLFSYKNISTILGDLNIRNLSSGLKTLSLALSLCEDVDVLGFGKDKNGQLGYYFRDTKFDFKPHAATPQWDFIKKLQKHKQIKLYMGNAEKRLPSDKH